MVPIFEYGTFFLLLIKYEVHWLIRRYLIQYIK